MRLTSTGVKTIRKENFHRADVSKIKSEQEAQLGRWRHEFETQPADQPGPSGPAERGRRGSIDKMTEGYGYFIGGGGGGGSGVAE